MIDKMKRFLSGFANGLFLYAIGAILFVILERAFRDFPFQDAMGILAVPAFCYGVFMGIMEVRDSV